jgi:hypothetical protein
VMLGPCRVCISNQILRLVAVGVQKSQENGNKATYNGSTTENTVMRPEVSHRRSEFWEPGILRNESVPRRVSVCCAAVVILGAYNSVRLLQLPCYKSVDRKRITKTSRKRLRGVYSDFECVNQ